MGRYARAARKNEEAHVDARPSDGAAARAHSAIRSGCPAMAPMRRRAAWPCNRQGAAPRTTAWMPWRGNAGRAAYAGRLSWRTASAMSCFRRRVARRLRDRIRRSCGDYGPVHRQCPPLRHECARLSPRLPPRYAVPHGRPAKLRSGCPHIDGVAGHAHHEAQTAGAGFFRRVAVASVSRTPFRASARSRRGRGHAAAWARLRATPSNRSPGPHAALRAAWPDAG